MKELIQPDFFNAVILVILQCNAQCYFSVCFLSISFPYAFRDGQVGGLDLWRKDNSRLLSLCVPPRDILGEPQTNLLQKNENNNNTEPMGGEVSDLQNKKQTSSEQRVTLITMLSNSTAADTVTARVGN